MVQSCPVNAFISDAVHPNERIIIRENNNSSEHAVPEPHVLIYIFLGDLNQFSQALLNSHKSNENNHFKPHRVPATAQKSPLQKKKNVETQSSLLDAPQCIHRL